MVSRAANSGKYSLVWGNIHGKPLFVEMIVTGKDFNVDLVADPFDPSDVAAAIGSDLELAAELMSEYGTILGLAVDGTYAEFIMASGSSFSDPAVAQEVFDRLEDDLGWTMNLVYVAETFTAYGWQAAT